MKLVKGIVSRKITKWLVVTVGGVPLLITGFVIVVSLLVILAVADAFANDSGTGAVAGFQLPMRVEAYRGLVTEACERHGMPEYVDLVLAIIAQESDGIGTDPMQSSQSSFNTEYPNTPGAIQDPGYSIECGIQTLKHLRDLAGLDDIGDMDRAKLVIQGYNFGGEYISWALEHGDAGYSPGNAEEYAALCAAETGADEYGDVYYVPKVMQYWKPGMGGGGTGTGLFMWPVPEHSTISGRFGDPRDGGPHRGLDISGDNCLGARIVAADDGVVVISEYGHWSWGNYVVINHGNGYTTLYAHCVSLSASVGQSVSAGETIAFVGNTGNSFGAHLHLEIEFSGVLVDPETLL